MVSAKSLVLLFGAVAHAAVMAVPAAAGEFAAAPPLVDAAPGIENVPNTVPKEALVSRDDGTHVQFWKEANFRGETISTNLDRGGGACCKFMRTVQDPQELFWDNYHAKSITDIFP